MSDDTNMISPYAICNLQYSCNIHAIYMQYSCDIYAICNFPIYMQYACSLPRRPYSSFAGRDASRGLATFSVEPVSVTLYGTTLLTSQSSLNTYLVLGAF